MLNAGSKGAPRSLTELSAMTPTLLSIKEAARYLGVSKKEVRGRLKRHELRGFKVHNQWRIPYEELQRSEAPEVAENAPETVAPSETNQMVAAPAELEVQASKAPTALLDALQVLVGKESEAHSLTLWRQRRCPICGQELETHTNKAGWDEFLRCQECEFAAHEQAHEHVVIEQSQQVFEKTIAAVRRAELILKARAEL